MPYYAPFYRPTYYDQMQTAQSVNQYNQQYQPMNQPAIPTPQANSGLIWVQGETGAKSYLVAPGNTVMLMDSEGDRFYLKSADASGMPLPLRTFEYKELVSGAVTAANAPVSGYQIDLGNYITREEFERRMALISSQSVDKKEGLIDAESVV